MAAHARTLSFTPHTHLLILRPAPQLAAGSEHYRAQKISAHQSDGPHVRVNPPYRRTTAPTAASPSTTRPTRTWTSTARSPCAFSSPTRSTRTCSSTKDASEFHFHFAVLGQPLCLTRLQTALHSEKSMPFVTRSRGWEEHTPPWHTGYLAV